MLTMSRRKLLVGGAAAAACAAMPATRSILAAEPGPARKLLLVVAMGGWDTTYALDPKPGLTGIDAPEGEVQMFGDLPIFTHASRPAVTDFFAAYGGISAVINGVQVQSIVHSDCSKRILTGTASDTNPDIGAITAFEHGRGRPAPYLVLGQTAYTGPYAALAARAGTANQIGILLDPSGAFPPPAGALPAFAPDADEEALIRAWVEARAAREIATRGQLGDNRARLEDFVSSLGRADDLRGFEAAFGEPDFTRDLNVQVGLAVQALESGLSEAVQLEDGPWDTHEMNGLQGPRHDAFFAALRALADELAARPGSKPGTKLLDETVVAVLSEMGRTPKLNVSSGKDHWNVTSALIFGAGVAGGRAYGGSGEMLESLPVNLATGDVDPAGDQIQFGNLAAGLLELAGVDASVHLPKEEAFRAFIA